MCCRRKWRGRRGVCDKIKEEERQIDRKKDSMARGRRQADSCPLGELALFFGPFLSLFILA